MIAIIKKIMMGLIVISISCGLLCLPFTGVLYGGRPLRGILITGGISFVIAAMLIIIYIIIGNIK